MLMQASKVGHEASVRALIEKGASVEAVDEVRILTCASYSEYQRHNNMQYMHTYIYVYMHMCVCVYIIIYVCV